MGVRPERVGGIENAARVPVATARRFLVALDTLTPLPSGRGGGDWPHHLRADDFELELEVEP